MIFYDNLRMIDTIIKKGMIAIKRKWFFLLTGILIGLFLGMSIGSGFLSQMHAVPASENRTDPLQQADATVQPSAGFIKATADLLNHSAMAAASNTQTTNQKTTEIPAWDASAVYVNGDCVLYSDHIYQAKWWTLGEIPSQADVWEQKAQLPATEVSKPLQTEIAASKDNSPIAAASTRIIGYYPSWKPQETDSIRYDVLTHIIYAFAIPTKDGGLLPLEHGDTASKIITEAHRQNKKALLAVGGWSYQDTPLEQTFMEATATPAKREALVSAIMDLCRQYHFDGVDLDWEHPRVDGSSSKQYEAFVLLLAEKLHAEGKLCTIAVLSGATADGNIYYDAAAHTDSVLNAIDWLHIMAYDGGDGKRHSSYQLAADSLQYWHVTRGVSREKLVLGVPFYARPSWASYGDIFNAVPKASQSDSVIYQGMDVWYNGIPTIQQKARLIIENHYGGIMIWEITQDTTDQKNSLQTAIAQVFQETAQ